MELLSRLDYSQYLLVSQVNYTLTNFADHVEGLSHDAINRYLAGEKLSPHLLWEHVEADIVASESGYLCVLFVPKSNLVAHCSQNTALALLS